jgi:hypothetical protein
MQTASVVAPGALRVGGQVDFAAWCGTPGAGLAVFSCNQFPDGIPLPEVRATARRGVGWASDVGASLQVATQIDAPELPLQVGLTTDVKRELFHLSGPGAGHVLSLGVLVAGAIAGRPGLSPTGQVEWGVPLFYGLQTTHFEWVAGLSFSQRVQFGGPPGLPARLSTRLGATLGLFRRDPAGFGVQLGYLTDVRLPTRGALQVQVGWLWDFAG